MIHNTANPQIRRELKENSIPFWKIAEKIGVSESTVVRWFRTELTPEQAERVNRSIQQILKENAEKAL